LVLSGALLAVFIGGVVVVTRLGWQGWGIEFFAGLGSSLIAFIAALMFENDRERRRVDRDEAQLSSRLITEMRRRLAPIHRELEANKDSLDDLGALKLPPREGMFLVLNPQLLAGAWLASATRLTELVPDYKLTGDLAFTYGRIEELRWRLRYRTEHHDAQLDAMIVPLVDEIRTEVIDLLARVRNVIDNPPDQPLGLLHNVGLVSQQGAHVQG
jgi:hypothetical protein